jgi:hypothetical protein
MTFLESSSLSNVVFEHDLFGKPVSTPDQVRGRPFPDHARLAVTNRLPIPKAADACATFSRESGNRANHNKFLTHQ